MTAALEERTDFPDVGLKSVPSPALRGRARARWRQAKAVELALAGYDYDTIAANVGYANRGTAWRAVQGALQDRVADNVDEHRALTMERLEALLAAHWTDATEHGDVKSAELVLKIIAQQIKLLGLELNGSESSETGRSVIIGGTSEEYIAAMKTLASHGADAD